jgi:hypothetical protein
LLEVARALPVASISEETVLARPGVPTWAVELARAEARPQDEGAGPSARAAAAPPSDLRRETAALLALLARRVDEVLAAALARAAHAWEQVDAVSVMDVELESAVAETRRRLAAAAHPAVPSAQRAVALEGLLVVDAAVALARLCERRMASLLRLRMRSPSRAFLPAGRPFLDLGAALREAAEAWR